VTRCGAWGGLGGHQKVPLHIAAVDMWSFEFANGFFFNAVVRPKCGKSMVINRMPMVPFLGWNSQKVRERAGGEFRACDPCLGRAGANMEAGSDLGTMGYPKALWCHQTWLAGQSLIKFDDFSIPMIQMLILFSSRVFHLSDSVRISNNDLTATTLDMIGL